MCGTGSYPAALSHHLSATLSANISALHTAARFFGYPSTCRYAHSASDIHANSMPPNRLHFYFGYPRLIIGSSCRPDFQCQLRDERVRRQLLLLPIHSLLDRILRLAYTYQRFFHVLDAIRLKPGDGERNGCRLWYRKYRL